MQWIENAEERKPAVLRLYDNSPENSPRLTFDPLRISDTPDWDPVPEDWSCCSEPLVVYFEDYKRLLKSYFALMFPTKDAFDGTPEPVFDELYWNWLGADDWSKALGAIRGDLPKFTHEERGFYEAFLRWFDKALELSNIIICQSNL
ncbi:MAG: hypothetical protein K2J80_08045 [Oscillospiraceae bacterium]|nr:hypothetical protein [Oscillospiraceae bacterium]